MWNKTVDVAGTVGLIPIPLTMICRFYVEILSTKLVAMEIIKDDDSR